jgi:hypothetical protein
MLSLLAGDIVSEAPHYELLGIELSLHAVSEEALEHPGSVVHYKGEDPLFVEVAREEGVEAIIYWELAHIDENLLRGLKHKGGVQVQGRLDQ